MPRGENKVVLDCTTELIQFMDSHKGDLRASFHMALTYLQYYKDEFVAKYGQQSYDEHIKRYSVSAVEQTRLANLEKQKEIEEKRRELDIREQEVKIKMGFLSAETQAMNDKHEEKVETIEAKKARENTKELKQLEHDDAVDQKWLEADEQSIREHPERKGDFEPLIAQIKERMAERNKRIAELREPQPQQQPHP
jgi:hypothetical protein